MRSRTILCALASCLMGVTAAACVGDDPAAGPSTEDGGSDVNVPPVDDGSDAGPSTPPPDKDAGHDAGVDAADAAPPEPPLASPNAWLDARTLTAVSITTWPDATANGADAVSAIAHTVNPKVLGGMPGVVFSGDSDQAFAIPAAKLPAFRAYSPTTGFTVFVVALYDDPGGRSSQSVIFARVKRAGTFPSVQSWGIQLSLDKTLTTLTGDMWNYTGGAQIDTASSGPAPSQKVPHLYVFRGQDNASALRVDGKLVDSASGFTESGFAQNGEIPFSIGSYEGVSSPQFDWIGAIGMVAVYTHALSDTQIQAGEQAAMKAWGIP